MNQARYLKLLRHQLREWRAIVDVTKSAGYYVDRETGRIETTQKRMKDYNRRIADTEALIKELENPSYRRTDTRPEAPSPR